MFSYALCYKIIQKEKSDVCKVCVNLYYFSTIIAPV